MDASGITPTVNQETGVITFSVMANVLVGDYVAMVTCGEADPLEITLTVTAPTNIDGITANPTTLSFTGLNIYKNFGFVHGTKFSQDPIEIIENTCTEPEKLTFEDLGSTFASTTGKWTRKYKFKQTQRITDRTQFTITAKCNNDTASVTVTPW